MRICYLANTAIPSTNASAIQIVKTCEAFSKLNQKVLLITTNANKAKIFDFYGVKTKFEFKKLKNFNKFPLGIKYYLFSLFSIIASLNFKPDIYITRNFFTCFLLTLIKKKTILELHHGLDIESRLVRFIVKFTNFLNSKYLVKLLAISKGAKIEYSSKHFVKKEKIIVLPSGSSISVNFENPFRRKKKKLGILDLYMTPGV